MEEWQTGKISKAERKWACSVWPELYPGVHGDVAVRKTFDVEITFINIIWAKKEGSGQVGKYLDSLTGIIIVDSVVSPRLRGMLERRGFVPYAGGSGMSRGL